MATQYSPLHLENTIDALAREDLKLPQAFTTYHNMLQDEYIGGGINLIKSLLNKQGTGITPNENATQADRAYFNALKQSYLNLEGLTPTQMMNYMLSCMEYGVAIFETVLERVNGRMVFKTFSPIHPKDVKRYVYKNNVLEEIVLTPAENDGLIDNGSNGQEVTITGDKIVMIRLNPDLDNPLGRSMLKRCYTTWKSKQIASEYELIGISKDLSGALKISVPSEYINDYYSDPKSANSRYVTQLLDQAEMLHAGKSSQVLVASDTQENGVGLFSVDLIGNSGGTRFDVNTTIERYNSSLLVTLYTDILALGNGKGGSYSLASSKTSLLGLFMESVMNAIGEGFSKAIKYAYTQNGGTWNNQAKLTWDDVEDIDFDEFSRAWQRLATAGVVTPTEDLEAYVRTTMNAPQADYSKKLVNTTQADPVDRIEEDKVG